jgi:hypothetical protein
MSRIAIVILIYRRHKPIDLIHQELLSEFDITDTVCVEGERK